MLPTGDAMARHAAGPPKAAEAGRPQDETAVRGPTEALAAVHGVHYELRILRSLRRIIRCVDLYSRQLSISNQITTPQLVCLLTVVEKGPLTATAISREVHLSPSTVVGILDRLEEKGWVARVRDSEDRRVVQVSATSAGIALSRQAPSPLQKTLANALNALPELEQATIALSLERIVALMEAQAIDASPILATGPINPSAP
jgi:DNA-binding MarR family transcriptional regulator